MIWAQPVSIVNACIVPRPPSSSESMWNSTDSSFWKEHASVSRG